LKKAVAVLGTACVTIPAAEGAACKDYIFGTVAVGGTLVSCCLTASLPWLVDHIRGDCVINSAAVEVSAGVHLACTAFVAAASCTAGIAVGSATSCADSWVEHGIEWEPVGVDFPWVLTL